MPDEVSRVLVPQPYEGMLREIDEPCGTPTDARTSYSPGPGRLPVGDATLAEPAQAPVPNFHLGP